MLYTGLRFYSLDQGDDYFEGGNVPEFLSSNRENPSFSRQEDKKDQE